MVSRQSRAALQVLVERKSRYTRLRKLKVKTAASMGTVPVVVEN
jgi:IS30 family transposase